MISYDRAESDKFLTFIAGGKAAYASFELSFRMVGR